MSRAIVVIGMLATVTATAAADELADARRLEAALEYEQALAIAERAIEHGGADRDRLAELHALGGKLAAGLDRAAAAEDHFARWLALRPDAALPEGTSPKITIPFAAARSRTRPLRVDSKRAGDRIEITIDDALGLVVQLRVHVLHVTRDSTAADIVVRPEPRIDVAVPERRDPVEVIALDVHGNRVDDTTLAPESLPQRSARARSPSPWWARGSTWALAGGGAFAVGGFCAWRFEVAQSDWNTLHNDGLPHDYSTLRAIEDRGNRWGAAANVSFGVAGLLAIALVAETLFTSGAANDLTSIAITAGRNSIGVVGRF